MMAISLNPFLIEQQRKGMTAPNPAELPEGRIDQAAIDRFKSQQVERKRSAPSLAEGRIDQSVIDQSRQSRRQPTATQSLANGRPSARQAESESMRALDSMGDKKPATLNPVSAPAAPQSLESRPGVDVSRNTLANGRQVTSFSQRGNGTVTAGDVQRSLAGQDFGKPGGGLSVIPGRTAGEQRAIDDRVASINATTDALRRNRLERRAQAGDRFASAQLAEMDAKRADAFKQSATTRQLDIEQQKADSDLIRSGAAQTAAEAQIAKASTPGQTEYQKALAKKSVDQFAALQERTPQLQNALIKLGRASELSADVSGLLATPRELASQIGQIFGGSGATAAKIQELEGISNELALANKDILGLTGVLSDSDIRLLQSTTVKPTNTDEANQSIIRQQIQLTTGIMQEAERQKQYVEQFGTLDGYIPQFNRDAAINSLAESNLSEGQRSTIGQLSQALGQEITARELFETAQNRGISVDDVLAQLQQIGGANG